MMIIGNKEFDLKNQVYIMGILNITPDSFSDGGSIFGRYSYTDIAAKKVEEMIKDGASIIDIGGESTRPGYEKITVEEEINRICPVIEKISKNFDIAISVDTYKSQVAKSAIDTGAHMVNDIWGLKADEHMTRIIADNNVACCIMHNRDVLNNPYTDFCEDVLTDLRESVKLALDNGIDKDKLIIDPGVGFGKDLEQNLYITANVWKLKELNLPILLGTSRKSMIGLTLDLPVDEREEGTMATTVMGILNGCSIIRVHDVKKNYRAAKMTLELKNRMEETYYEQEK